MPAQMKMLSAINAGRSVSINNAIALHSGCHGKYPEAYLLKICMRKDDKNGLFLQLSFLNSKYSKVCSLIYCKLLGGIILSAAWFGIL